MDKNKQKQSFKLISLVSAKWIYFGIRVGQTYNDLDCLENQYMRDFRVCWCKVMKQWLDNEGTDEYPATWRGVIKMLEDVECCKAAKDLETALSSVILPPTHYATQPSRSPTVAQPETTLAPKTETAETEVAAFYPAKQAEPEPAGNVTKDLETAIITPQPPPPHTASQPPAVAQPSSTLETISASKTACPLIPTAAPDENAMKPNPPNPPPIFRGSVYAHVSSALAMAVIVIFLAILLALLQHFL